MPNPANASPHALAFFLPKKMINPIKNDNSIVIINKELLRGNLLDESEFWLLVKICSKMDYTNSCYLQNKELLELTGWGLDKLLKNKKSLVSKKIIIVTEQRTENGNFSINLYQIPNKI